MQLQQKNVVRVCSCFECKHGGIFAAYRLGLHSAAVYALCTDLRTCSCAHPAAMTSKQVSSSSSFLSLSLTSSKHKSYPQGATRTGRVSRARPMMRGESGYLNLLDRTHPPLAYSCASLHTCKPSSLPSSSLRCHLLSLVISLCSPETIWGLSDFCSRVEFQDSPLLPNIYGLCCAIAQPMPPPSPPSWCPRSWALPVSFFTFNACSCVPKVPFVK
jgi:hypothetical protein